MTRKNSRLYFVIKNMGWSKSKRSQSQIISTVLLILLAVVSAMVIFSFAIPFITDKLEAGNCVDVAGKVNIVDDFRYSCYESDGNISVKVKIGDVRELIEGFTISINAENDKTVTIRNDTIVTGVTGLKDGNFQTVLELPTNNGAIVYKIDHGSLPDSVEIYPILKGGLTCDSTYNPIAIYACPV